MALPAKQMIRRFKSYPMLHFMTYFITFAAVFVTDFLYTNFVRAVQQSQPLAASLWSVLVTFSASVAVINYTSDNWQLIPALLGAGLGTYCGVIWKNRSSQH